MRSDDDRQNGTHKMKKKSLKEKVCPNRFNCV